MQDNIRRAQNPRRIFLDLIFSILIPSFLLTKGENYIAVEPVTLFLIALFFPTAYGLYDLLIKKYVNIISILGFINTLLSGVVVIFSLSKFFIILKEAGFPLLIGISLLYYNKSVLEFIKIITDDILNKRIILTKISQKKLNKWYKNIATYFSYPFFLSGFLNFLITYIIIQSPVGTEAFNDEMGRLIFWGFLGISLPTTIATLIIFIVGFSQLKNLTKLSFEELMLSEEEIKNNQKKIKELD